MPHFFLWYFSTVVENPFLTHMFPQIILSVSGTFSLWRFLTKIHGSWRDSGTLANKLRLFDLVFLPPSFLVYVYWNDAVPGRLLGAKASTECDDRGSEQGSSTRQLLHHPDHVASSAQELPRVPRGHLPRHSLAGASARAPGLVAGCHDPARQVLPQPRLQTSGPHQVWTLAV